jgi:Gas vesicle synthesis protein GvpL/GvpF
MIYAYAVGEPATLDPLPRRRGFGGAALRVAIAGDLAAAYSRHRTQRPRPTPEAMWTHERVVEALMDRGPVLPMRFGTVLDDDEALAAMLRARRDELAAALQRVRGRVELGLRVVADRPAREAGAQNGRAYVLARLDEYRRAERAARDVHEPLAALACESRVRPRTPAPTLLATSYLVERGDVRTFRARVEEAAAACPGVHVVCTGPWPPYSFTEPEPA